MTKVSSATFRNHGRHPRLYTNENALMPLTHHKIQLINLLALNAWFILCPTKCLCLYRSFRLLELWSVFAFIFRNRSCCRSSCLFVLLLFYFKFLLRKQLPFSVLTLGALLSEETFCVSCELRSEMRWKWFKMVILSTVGCAISSPARHCTSWAARFVRNFKITVKKVFFR